MKHILFSAFFLVAFSGLAVAQAPATGTVNTAVVKPVGLTEIQDLNFGNIVTTPAGGTVIENNGVMDYTSDPGSSPGTQHGPIGDAIFVVTGQPGFLVNLDVVIGESSPAFVLNPVPGITYIGWNPAHYGVPLDGTGSATVHVNGQLGIAPNASDGQFKFTWTEIASYD